jgi:NAD+ synthase (glutamine-hydrolysing)
MPSRYSSAPSLADAQKLASNLGITLHTVPIEAAHAALAGMLASELGAPPGGLTDENLQARIRGVVLMALCNARGWMLLATGNKSELATGYFTLYGDSAGGFAVVKDVPKTLVYRLCEFRNGRSRNCNGATTGASGVIPELVLSKAPSAELRPEQRDDDSLPPYQVLDPILAAYVEEDRTSAELVTAGFDPELVKVVTALVDRAEYKRRQGPPGVRVSPKAFGKDRRAPITNRYGQGR